jgi:hypothetical protein
MAAVILGFFAGILLKGVAVLNRRRQAVQTRKRTKGHVQGSGSLLELAYLAWI